MLEADGAQPARSGRRAGRLPAVLRHPDAETGTGSGRAGPLSPLLDAGTVWRRPGGRGLPLTSPQLLSPARSFDSDSSGSSAEAALRGEAEHAAASSAPEEAHLPAAEREAQLVGSPNTGGSGRRNTRALPRRGLPTVVTATGLAPAVHRPTGYRPSHAPALAAAAAAALAAVSAAAGGGAAAAAIAAAFAAATAVAVAAAGDTGGWQPLQQVPLPRRHRQLPPAGPRPEAGDGQESPQSPPQLRSQGRTGCRSPVSLGSLSARSSQGSCPPLPSPSSGLAASGGPGRAAAASGLQQRQRSSASSLSACGSPGCWGPTLRDALQGQCDRAPEGSLPDTEPAPASQEAVRSPPQGRTAAAVARARLHCGADGQDMFDMCTSPCSPDSQPKLLGTMHHRVQWRAAAVSLAACAAAPAALTAGRRAAARRAQIAARLTAATLAAAAAVTTTRWAEHALHQRLAQEAAAAVAAAATKRRGLRPLDDRLLAKALSYCPRGLDAPLLHAVSRRWRRITAANPPVGLTLGAAAPLVDSAEPADPRRHSAQAAAPRLPHHDEARRAADEQFMLTAHSDQRATRAGAGPDPRALRAHVAAARTRSGSSAFAHAAAAASVSLHAAAAWEALLRSAHCLRSLTIRTLSCAHFEVKAALGCLMALSSLDLGLPQAAHGTLPQWFGALADLPCAPRLRSLSVHASGICLGQIAFSTLAEVPVRLPSLQRMTALRHLRLTAGAAFIAAHTLPEDNPRLRTLLLPDCSLAAADHAAALGALGQLEVYDVGCRFAPPPAWGELCGRAAALRRLTLRSAGALAPPPAAARLKELALHLRGDATLPAAGLWDLPVLEGLVLSGARPPQAQRAPPHQRRAPFSSRRRPGTASSARTTEDGEYEEEEEEEEDEEEEEWDDDEAAELAALSAAAAQRRTLLTLRCPRLQRLELRDCAGVAIAPDGWLPLSELAVRGGSPACCAALLAAAAETLEHLALAGAGVAAAALGGQGAAAAIRRMRQLRSADLTAPAPAAAPAAAPQQQQRPQQRVPPPVVAALASRPALRSLSVLGAAPLPEVAAALSAAGGAAADRYAAGYECDSGQATRSWLCGAAGLRELWVDGGADALTVLTGAVGLRELHVAAHPPVAEAAALHYVSATGRRCAEALVPGGGLLTLHLWGEQPPDARRNQHPHRVAAACDARWGATVLRHRQRWPPLAVVAASVGPPAAAHWHSARRGGA
eukprot:TRINITY_DN9101_c0_g1_i2.p1 TRINITY_DN9101_c0_g1~~TRINITY_DN9101_c0_g1_i2.p1  ORF type:complete len:1220 (+),score=285.82 TRINITY_DN9101_c0_g1_i2:80-3739(+)